MFRGGIKIHDRVNMIYCLWDPSVLGLIINGVKFLNTALWKRRLEANFRLYCDKTSGGFQLASNIPLATLASSIILMPPVTTLANGHPLATPAILQGR